MSANPNNLLDYAADGAVPAARSLIDSLRGTEPLGMGWEKVVYDYKDGKVVSFLPHHGVKGLKELFYTQKLLHLILPQNIPDVHLVGSQPPLMILDKIEIGPDLTYEAKWDATDGLVEKLGEIGVQRVDMSPGNFLQGTDGNLRYVDTLRFNAQNLYGLERAIDGLEVSEAQKGKRYAQKAGLTLPKN